MNQTSQQLPSFSLLEPLGEALLFALLVALLYWLLRRYQQQNNLMRLCAKLPLDHRRTLYVIDVAGSYYLVGGGDDGLRTLAKLDPDKVKPLLATQPASWYEAIFPHKPPTP